MDSVRDFDSVIEVKMLKMVQTDVIYYVQSGQRKKGSDVWLIFASITLRTFCVLAICVLLALSVVFSLTVFLICLAAVYRQTWRL